MEHGSKQDQNRTFSKELSIRNTKAEIGCVKSDKMKSIFNKRDKISIYHVSLIYSKKKKNRHENLFLLLIIALFNYFQFHFNFYS